MVGTIGCRLDTIGTDGNPGLTTDIDVLAPVNLRYKTNDDPTIDTIDPIPIPTSGTVYSYWKSLFIIVEIAPDTQIDNIRFFTDGGGYGTGISLNVGDQFPTHTTASEAGYELATGTPGVSGDEIIANHSGISSVTEAFNFTSISPLVGPTISEPAGFLFAVGETTDYLITQAAILSTATPGVKTAETLTFQYDEI